MAFTACLLAAAFFRRSNSEYEQFFSVSLTHFARLYSNELTKKNCVALWAFPFFFFLVIAYWLLVIFQKVKVHRRHFLTEKKKHQTCTQLRTLNNLMQFLFKTKKTSEKFYAPIIKRLSSKRFSAARFEIEIFGTILTDYHYSILLFWDGSIYDKKS